MYSEATVTVNRMDNIRGEKEKIVKHEIRIHLSLRDVIYLLLHLFRVKP